MHCHDVLGIKETAVYDEIENAYNNKIEAISYATNTLQKEAIEKKTQELKSAKEECIEWTSMTTAQKVEKRITEAVIPSNGSIKLYSCGDFVACLLPCTCLDTLSYECLCNCGTGNSANAGSVCAEISPSCRYCPYISDGLIWLTIISNCIFALLPSTKRPGKTGFIKARKEERKRKRIDNAEQRLAGFRQQYEECKSKEARINQTLQNARNNQKGIYEGIALFSALGVSGHEAIAANQRALINQLTIELENVSQQEKELLAKISQEQRIINNG